MSRKVRLERLRGRDSSDISAKCLDLNCPPLLAIKNGYLTYTANFPFDSTVAYSCEDHFVLLGNAERRCQGNGQWSGGEPTCVTSGKAFTKDLTLAGIELGVLRFALFLPKSKILESIFVIDQA